MRTMDDEYEDGSDHEMCDICGFCMCCGDCDKYGCGDIKTTDKEEQS